MHAANDHGDAVVAHRRLQFVNVDKTTILSPEDAEGVFNSLAVWGMDLPNGGARWEFSFAAGGLEHQMRERFAQPNPTRPTSMVTMPI